MQQNNVKHRRLSPQEHRNMSKRSWWTVYNLSWLEVNVFLAAYTRKIITNLRSVRKTKRIKTSCEPSRTRRPRVSIFFKIVSCSCHMGTGVRGNLYLLHHIVLHDAVEKAAGDIILHWLNRTVLSSMASNCSSWKEFAFWRRSQVCWR